MRSREGIHIQTCCGVNSKYLPRSLAAVDEVERWRGKRCRLRETASELKVTDELAVCKT